MSVRSTDSNKGLYITRGVPVWGLITAIGTVILYAVLSWAQLQAQGTLITTISTQMGEIIRSLSANNLKDLEHDLKIGALTNQVNSLASRLSSIEANLPRHSEKDNK